MRPFSAFFLLSVFLWLTPARLDAQTVLHYTSESGDYIGEGQERTLTPDKGYNFQVNGSSAGSVSFYITGNTIAQHQFYGLQFAAPSGTNLTVGNYPGATRYPFQEAGQPGLNFDANGAGSNTLTGQFQVLEISFDASGNLATFAANFVQHSEGAQPACYGEIRYNSSIPYLNPAGTAQLSASTYSLLEIAGHLTVNVTRREGSTGPLSVDYSTTDGTDLAGRDYTATSGTLTWADGDAADKTFTVPILDSGNPLQGNGTFLVNLSGAGAGAQTQATVTIVNDDSAVTFVHFVSDKGDYIGAGQESSFSTANGYKISVSSSNGGVNVSVDGDDSISSGDDEWWYLDFAAATGSIFGVGDYENAERAPFKSAGHPGLDVSGDGRGSNTLTGSFQVRELQYDDDGNVLKFAADFVQHSEGGVPALRGQVRYNSTVPLPTTVSVAATDPVVIAGTGSTGIFTVTRTGDTSAPLIVYYSMGGSARGGGDYQALKGAKVIKAGKSSARIQVHPLGVGPVGKLVAKMTVQAQDGGSGSYVVSGENTAKVKLYPAGSTIAGPRVGTKPEPLD